MSLIFERIHTEGIAQLSYLIGDSGTGQAAVIDPRPDCDVYLQLCRQHGVGSPTFSKPIFTPIS